MKLQLFSLVVFIFLMLAAAQFSPAAGSGLAAVTPTPTPASGAGEGDDHSAAMAPGEPGRLFQVAIATYLLDATAFHEMDERINGEGVIEAGDAGVVSRINTVLGATAWPEELRAQVDPLRVTLSQYAEALSGDDPEAAGPLATQTHNLQHDLSHAAEHWLGEMTGSATTAIDEQEQLFQVAIATYLLDATAFHELDERLNGQGVIEAGDAGVVNRINTVLAATVWPEELRAQVEPLQVTLSQYAEVLANDDLAAARPLATQVHDLQHDLSHAAEHWLGEKAGSAEHGQEHDEHDPSTP